jgi:RNA polymerase sigma-70 factor (ECF subfamily)
MVYRLLVRFVGASADIDDLVQSTYVECFRSLPSFRGEAAFTTWLGSICVRVAWAHKKRELRRQVEMSRLAVVHDAANVEPEQLAITHERARALESLLADLTPTLRIPFVLHVIEALDINTVAAMTKTSVAATYKNVQRARAQIERAARVHPALSRGEP